MLLVVGCIVAVQAKGLFNASMASVPPAPPMVPLTTTFSTADADEAKEKLDNEEERYVGLWRLLRGVARWGARIPLSSAYVHH